MINNFLVLITLFTCISYHVIGITHSIKIISAVHACFYSFLNKFLKCYLKCITSLTNSIWLLTLCIYVIQNYVLLFALWSCAYFCLVIESQYQIKSERKYHHKIMCHLWVFLCFLKCAISSFLLCASNFALLICKCCVTVRIFSFYLTHNLWIFLSCKFIKKTIVLLLSSMLFCKL